MGVFVIWRLSFVEIVMHGDSTTVAIISKNNVLVICFTFNGVSFFFGKKFIGWAFDIYGVFCKEKNSFHAQSSSLKFFVLKNRCRWAFLSFGVFLLSKSSCMGTQPLCTLFLKITYWYSASLSMVFLFFLER